LADLDPARLGTDTSVLVTLGHSAGGQLAAWAAGRHRFARWRPVRVPVTHVISQAGVLDLRRAAVSRLGTEAVTRFVGGPLDDPAYAEAYDWADPAGHVPLEAPVWCVHGTADDTVPIGQSERYLARARAAGAQAELVAFEGGHFDAIDPAHAAWSAVVGILDGISASARR
ncbi:MAG: alpha/beta hydrolase family protein, partial [Nocardioides sp.]